MTVPNKNKLRQSNSEGGVTLTVRLDEITGRNFKVLATLKNMSAGALANKLITDYVASHKKLKDIIEEIHQNFDLDSLDEKIK